MCWCSAGQINKALKNLKKDWLPSLVQLLVLGNTTGKHWRTLASTGDQWAGETVLQSSSARLGAARAEPGASTGAGQHGAHLAN